MLLRWITAALMLTLVSCGGLAGGVGEKDAERVALAEFRAAGYLDRILSDDVVPLDVKCDDGYLDDGWYCKVMAQGSDAREPLATRGYVVRKTAGEAVAELQGSDVCHFLVNPPCDTSMFYEAE